MPITNTWSVKQMDAYPQHNDEVNVVFNVHWTLVGTDGEHTASVYGSSGVTLDADAPFTPYSELTEEQVIGWVHDALGAEQVAAYEDNIAQQIDSLINPPVVRPELPWSA